jgi:hypothetical protein
MAAGVGEGAQNESQPSPPYSIPSQSFDKASVEVTRHVLESDLIQIRRRTGQAGLLIAQVGPK